MDPEQQLREAQKMIYQGYISEEATGWQDGLKALRRLNQQQLGEEEVAYELAAAEYGYIGYCITHQQRSGLRELISKCEGRTQGLLRKEAVNVRAHALMGGLLGMKMRENASLILLIGPRSMNHIDTACKLGPSVPEAWVEMANMKLNSPMIFGGSTDEAIKSYRKALQLYEDQPQHVRRSWQHLHAHAWLAQCYEKKGRYQLALEAYEQVLEFEPGFRWVANDLLPRLNKRIN